MREKRIAEKKRIEEEKIEEERRRKDNERIAIQRKKEVAAAKAKDRKETMQGCGCLIGLLAGAAFLVWWWMEGFSSEFLKEFPSEVDAALQGRWWMVAVVVAAVAIVYCFAARGSDATAAKSKKKRWLFVVLGLLLGWLGVHLAYAKRWFLFFLLWAGLITGGTLYDSKPQAADGNEALVASGAVEQSEAANPFQGNSRYGAIGFGVWALLWIGGALFIRKDGKGNRM